MVNSPPPPFQVEPGQIGRIEAGVSLTPRRVARASHLQCARFEGNILQTLGWRGWNLGAGGVEEDGEQGIGKRE